MIEFTPLSAEDIDQHIQDYVAVSDCLQPDILDKIAARFVGAFQPLQKEQTE